MKGKSMQTPNKEALLAMLEHQITYSGNIRETEKLWNIYHLVQKEDKPTSNLKSLKPYLIFYFALLGLSVGCVIDHLT
jgi:hypothetical protein